MKKMIKMAIICGLGVSLISAFLISTWTLAQEQSKRNISSSSKTLYERVKHGMERFDLNGNGILDAEERVALRNERRPKLEKLKARVFERFDTNGNGVLDDDEKVQIQEFRGRREKVRGRALDKWDKNQDGVFDLQEEQQMRSEQQAFLRRMKNKTRETFDRNGNGKLDPTERKAMRAMLQKKR